MKGPFFVAGRAGSSRERPFATAPHHEGMGLDERLRELAHRVAEAEAVDWNDVEVETESPDERKVLRGLRGLTEIVKAHRGAHDPSESITSPTPPGRGRLPPEIARWGDLVILKRLGEGGYGEVFLAHDPKLDRHVALKLYHGDEPAEGDVRSLIHEGRLLARIKHPNVITVHGADRREGRAGIWMELIRGKTLSQLVSEQGPFSPSVAALIGVDLCRALAAVHSHMIHRDIKAQNVMRESGGRIVLMDFGIGALSSEEAPGLIGTPNYLAPEVFEGEPPSVQSDLYGLGVLLFHLVTGDFPVRGREAEELAEAHRRGRRVFLRDLRPDSPDPFVRAIEKCLSPDPKDRFASAGEMEMTLAEATGLRELGGPSAAGDRDDAAPTRAFPWRHPALLRLRPRAGRLALGAALAAGALAVGLALVLDRASEPLASMEQPTLAVLPIENLTGDEANAFLAAGITDVLTSRLASIPGLLVVPRSVVERASAGFSGSARPEVSHFVEGSLQRSNDALRFSVRLTSSKEAAVFWSAVFDGTVDRFFLLQQQAVEGLVRELGEMRLESEELEVLRVRLGEPPTLDMEAFAAYSQAKLDLERYDLPGRLDRAVEGFEDAIARDPGFALAHAGLGEACWRKFDTTREESWIDRARDATLEALRLDPEEPSVRFTLAVIYEFTGRREQAIEELERVLTLQPASVQALRLLGRIHARLGAPERSRDYFDRAIALRPADPANFTELGLALFRLGNYREAAGAFETLVRLDPGNPSAHQRLGAAYHALGDLDRARKSYEQVLARAPSASAYSNLGAIHFAQRRYRDAVDAYLASLELDAKSPDTMRNLGEAYHAMGEYERSRSAYEKVVELTENELRVNPRYASMLSLQALAEAKLGRTGDALAKVERAAELDPGSYEVGYHRAAVHALAGEDDEALRLLEKAIEAGYPTTLVAADPDWESLRGLPEFHRILAR